MQSFTYQKPDTAQAAVQTAAGAAGPHMVAPAQFLAGGTTLLDLMKLDLMRPDVLIDIKSLDPSRYAAISRDSQGLRIGALCRMSDVAVHPAVKRDYPLLSQSLLLAASQQLRNMARVGGNVLQRTRCIYFREISFEQCNKRNPGSGCAARDGYNRKHAILGTSDSCIATYPGDFAQGLIALDAAVELLGPEGSRVIPFATLHRPPGNTPHIETNLRPGELITAFTISGEPWPQSLYLKIRDRDSYEFALASAAVALRMNGAKLQEARIALGGVAARPWRATAAEAMLAGRELSAQTAAQAAQAAFAGARPYSGNAFKQKLGQATLVRALLQAREITA